MDKIVKLKQKINQYPYLRFLMGCPYRAPKWNKRVSTIIKDLGDESLILDLGSGNRRRSKRVINLDIGLMPNVDVLGDGSQLPFKDNIFDLVILEAVLEHVRNPNMVISEVHRVLRKGGYVCASVPFVYSYHASPGDYQRYTIEGLDNLHSAFQKIESGSCQGATSTLHLILREYIGILLSFGNIWLYKALSLFIGWITFPMVFFDSLLQYNKNSDAIANAVYYIGKKK
ncbi:TPA: class I SAM-dependent methyltransferase [bacterium]|nr:class I SAM-dependent methyltransferase [bacterium]